VSKGSSSKTKKGDQEQHPNTARTTSHTDKSKASERGYQSEGYKRNQGEDSDEEYDEVRVLIVCVDSVCVCKRKIE